MQPNNSKYNLERIKNRYSDIRLPRWPSGKKIHLPMQETWVWSLGQEDPLEEEMATHSSVLAWKISWTENPGRLQSMESQSYAWATEHGKLGRVQT